MSTDLSIEFMLDHKYTFYAFFNALVFFTALFIHRIKRRNMKHAEAIKDLLRSTLIKENGLVLWFAMSTLVLTLGTCIVIFVLFHEAKKGNLW